MPKLMLDVGVPSRKKLRVNKKTVIRLIDGSVEMITLVKKGNQWVEEGLKKESE